MRHRFFVALLFALSALVLFVSSAWAAGADPPQHALTLSPDQTWVALIGALVPLGTYLLNHYAPWCSEHVKGLVLTILSGASGALYKLIETGGLSLNASTVQYVLTGIAAALFAHGFLYKPAGINVKLKATANVQDRRRPARS